MNQLRSHGVQPANIGSCFERVPIDIVGLQPESLRAAGGGKATATLRYPADLVAWGRSSTRQRVAKAPVVFVGYGTSAPEYEWDDFRGVDVRGGILLVLVNDPPVPSAEPTLFGASAMTYYGR